jgi:branched-chain amino acid transport system ATP-binding protein
MTTMTAPEPTAAVTGSGDPILVLDDVNTYYGNIHALQGVSMTVGRGEIVTLLGANGAGKTTTLKTISGLLHPRRGSVHFEGQDITRPNAHELVRRGIGHAPEGRRIFARMTVLENLQMGAFTRNQKEIQPDIDRVMDLFPRLRERVYQLGGTLSGGEQQLLAIGRALMSEPRVLLLDEPSLGLAPMIVREIFRIVRELNEREGLTVLVVEQDARIALRTAARAYVLEVGRVAVAGTSDELQENESVRRSYLGY